MIIIIITVVTIIIWRILKSDIFTLRSLPAKIFNTLQNNAFVGDTLLIIIVAYSQGIP